jgi:hypothetical protein
MDGFLLPRGRRIISTKRFLRFPGISMIPSSRLLWMVWRTNAACENRDLLFKDCVAICILFHGNMEAMRWYRDNVLIGYATPPLYFLIR